jgi:hypothetical protein
VCDLVVDHVGHPLELGLGGPLRVDQQRGLPERHAAEVLHRAEREVRHRDQIELVGRVGQSEVVLEEAERERARLEGEGGQGRLARRVRDAQRRAVHVDRLGDLQRPDDEGDEVGRHLHRLGEADLDPSLAGWGAVDLCRVRQGGEVVVDDQGDLEGGLRLRLVPAGEGATGVGGLELGGGDHVAGAVVGGERRPVEAVQLVVEDAPERSVQGRLPGGQLPAQRERGPLGALVVGHLGVEAAAVGLLDPGLVDLELDAVEHDLADRLGHLELDGLPPGEGERSEVGFEGDGVPGGHDGARKAVLVGHEDAPGEKDGKTGFLRADRLPGQQIRTQKR